MTVNNVICYRTKTGIQAKIIDVETAKKQGEEARHDVCTVSEQPIDERSTRGTNNLDITVGIELFCARRD